MSTTPPPPPSGDPGAARDPGDGAMPPPSSVPSSMPAPGSTPPPPPSAPTASAPPPAPSSMPPPGAMPAPADPVGDAEGEDEDPGPDTPVAPSEVNLSGGDAAKLHATQLTRTYPCGQCGGELWFDIAQGGLACEHCGNQQPITNEGIEDAYEQDLEHAIAALRSGALDRVQAASADEHEVVCQNCGGQTTFTGSLTATKCPYCATPIQRADVHAAPTRLPVDGVLPFSVPEPQANELITEWIDSRWFAPNAFKKYSESGSFRSLYTAYFTYDAKTRSEYRGQRGDNYTVVVGSGENRRTETRIRWRRVRGTVANDFDDVSVLANEGLDHEHVSALEPWPTASVQGYNPQYIAGHLCRTYDKDVEQCFPEAKQRFDAAIESSIRLDIGGDHQRIQDVKSQYWDLTYKHLLLPIWLLTVLFAGVTYQVFINGVTGEVQGQRPYSKLKIALTILLGIAIAIGLYLGFSE